MIENDLLSVDDVLNRFNTPETQEKVARIASLIIVSRLVRSIPAFVPSSISNLLAESIRAILNREAPALIERITGQISNYLRSEVHLGKIVEEKILSYQLDELENLVIAVAQREFRHIEWLGGVLGLLIGLMQVGIIYLFR
ncbi:MAG: DUF445 family protein [Firmicutes bacterium]|nr:DUF445 family protein [Bacillota bacterium]